MATQIYIERNIRDVWTVWMYEFIIMLNVRRASYMRQSHKNECATETKEEEEQDKNETFHKVFPKWKFSSPVV